MPVTMANSDSGAALLQNMYSKKWVEAVFRNEFLALLPSVVKRGDTAARWLTNKTANDSVETFTEGQVMPDYGQMAPFGCEA